MRLYLPAGGGSVRVEVDATDGFPRFSLKLEKAKAASREFWLES